VFDARRIDEMLMVRTSMVRRWIAIAGLEMLLAAPCLAHRVCAAEVAASGAAPAASPADEIYQVNEARRRDLIARQLDLNYRMIRSSGYGPSYPNAFVPYSFESLARMPGDIWGYPQPRPIEHPVGHESAQTGPNRWIYRPIYAAEVQARYPAAASALPPATPSNVPGAAQPPGPSDPFDGELPAAPQEPGLRKAGPRAF
jgi:hypothetical protein